MRPAGPKCYICKTIIIGARVVLNGRWTCPACAYQLECGRSVDLIPDARTTRRRPRTQEETLFPVEGCEESPSDLGWG
jgi:hypothetical protein